MKKKFLLSVIVVCSFFFFIIKVKANTINKIDMDVYLDKNGNAKITEIWDASLNQGTEGYRPYTNLGNSKITNFSVSDEDGTTYEFLEKWNTKANFNTKAYKCGFNKISGGVELCWGISKYGERTYILKYDITNFVVNYSDYQGIYFNFLNLDQSIGGATIKIHSDVPFSIDNSKIWAFGYEGTINFVDGDIILDSNGLLGSYEYMVALVKFENNLFNTTNTSDKTFDTIKESAFSDVDDLEYKNSTKNNNSKKDKLYNAFMIFCYLFFTPLGWFMLYGILVLLKGKEWVLGSERYSGELVFGEEGKKLPKDADINYFREIPCNKDLERAYFICKTYSVEVDSTIKEGIIGAIFLKWIRDKKVNVSKTRRGLFNLKDNDYAIDFSRMENAENEIEEELFQMLLSAAGSNKILEAKEFKKWSKNNCLKISKWFDKIILKEEKYLENEGLIVKSTEETAAMFGRKKMITVKNVDPKLKEEAIKLKGLKKFLLDFSMMPEREYFEVHIWEEYLMFAELLGIAKKVSEQFSKLYPSFQEQTMLNTEITIYAARNFASICYTSMQSGMTSYSSGGSYSGGGGSSFSSGGSSSGGSSGGGFR